jgi:hypothetical protein
MARLAGRTLPAKVPPGQANPLDDYWLGLSLGEADCPREHEPRHRAAVLRFRRDGRGRSRHQHARTRAAPLIPGDGTPANPHDDRAAVASASLRLIRRRPAPAVVHRSATGTYERFASRSRGSVPSSVVIDAIVKGRVRVPLRVTHGRFLQRERRPAMGRATRPGRARQPCRGRRLQPRGRGARSPVGGGACRSVALRA